MTLALSIWFLAVLAFTGLLLVTIFVASHAVTVPDIHEREAEPPTFDPSARAAARKLLQP